MHAAATPPSEIPPLPEGVEAKAPTGKVVHADNYAGHEHPNALAWLARHPRFTFHFTPTSASWLNAVEGFFAVLTKRRLKRVRSIVDLQDAITHYFGEHNLNSEPFTWTKDSDKIIAAVARRSCDRITTGRPPVPMITPA